MSEREQYDQWLQTVGRSDKDQAIMYMKDMEEEIKELRAEIERKDEALSLSLWYMDVGELEARHNGWCRTAVIEKMKQALSTKEDSGAQGTE